MNSSESGSNSDDKTADTKSVNKMKNNFILEVVLESVQKVTSNQTELSQTILKYVFLGLRCDH